MADIEIYSIHTNTYNNMFKCLVASSFIWNLSTGYPTSTSAKASARTPCAKPYSRVQPLKDFVHFTSTIMTVNVVWGPLTSPPDLIVSRRKDSFY